MKKQFIVTIEQQGIDMLAETTVKTMLEFAKNNPNSCGFYDDIEVLSVESIENQGL